MKKDFITIHDLSTYEFQEMMDLTEKMKKNPGKYRKVLKDKILAMIFQKPSLRTRMTFEVGMLQLRVVRPFTWPPRISRWAPGKASGTSARTSSAGWTAS